ncbi:integrase catalytic domain-containing protein [Trichonephila clavata]|uniref:Integrase catalytic domain-containing protein n=1 Tax=Trichonephila clavata TaxID=2740835 RepID=A0A8X6GBW6_TRICU|nr:integrase catalytic domain-containing protein [Trichonephila clavata]
MDDLISGCSSITSAKQLKQELISLFSGAGMQLHKWSSNCIELLSNFDVSDGDVSLTIPDETKDLRHLWRPQKDTLAFSVSSIADVSDSCTITKRSVLSATARIFDPLGLISPAVTKAKLVMQELWRLTLDRNDSWPIHLVTQWTRFVKPLAAINNLNIPRYILLDDALRIELHGEFKKSDSVCLVTQNVELLLIIHKCSSLVKLKIIFAWCLRFKENASNPPSQRTIGSLTATELSRALICLIRNVQSVYFPLEIQCLLKGKQIPNSSSVLNLSPFSDENSILRIGGRLLNTPT